MIGLPALDFKNVSHSGSRNSRGNQADELNLEEISDSEQSHNISTLGSSYQPSQPKFLQRFGLDHLAAIRNGQREWGHENGDTSKYFWESQGSISQGTRLSHQAQDPEVRMGGFAVEPKANSDLELKGTKKIENENGQSFLVPLKHDDGQFGVTPENSASMPVEKKHPVRKSHRLSRLPGLNTHHTNGWKRLTYGFLFRKRTKSLYHQILKKEINLLDIGYGFVDDKAHVWDENTLNKENAKPFLKNLKKKPRLKELLEKHSMVREDIKTDFVKRLLKRIEQRKKTKIEMVIGIFAQMKTFISKFVKSLFSKSLQLLKPWHPHCKRRIVWDIISAFYTMYEIIFVPFYIAFDDANQTMNMIVFELIKDFFFFVEVFLNFHTGYVADGVVVLAYKEIAKNYIRRWFVVDLIVNMPYTEIIVLSTRGMSDLLTNSYSDTIHFSRLLKVLRVMKFVKIKRIISKFQDRLIQSQIANGILSLIKILLYIVFLAHWIACFWHFVGRQTEDTHNTWLIEHGFQTLSVTERYVISLYWAITTMLTVGYGDITPVNMVERMTNIIAMLIGCAMFAYSMNSVGILLQNINTEVSKKRNKYQLITTYLKRKNAPKEMQNKVQKYLDYLFENNNQVIGEEEKALDLLSDSLQDELRKEINGKVLRDNIIFQVIYGTRFLSLLSKNLEDKIFSPGESIFDESEVKHAMYFISAGSVELYFAQPRKTIKILEKGNHFGEISFFSGKRKKDAAMSVTFSSIFLLRREKFLALLEEHSSEKEIYNQIKDKINIYQNYEDLKLVCYACGQQNHPVGMCPNIHYKLDSEKVIRRYIDKQNKFCQQFQRRTNKKKFKAVLNVKWFESCSDTICRNYFDVIKEIINCQVPSVKSLLIKKQNSETKSNPKRSIVDNPMFIDLFQLGNTNQISSKNFKGNSFDPGYGGFENEDGIMMIEEASVEEDINFFEEASFKYNKGSLSNRDQKPLNMGLFISGFDAVKNYSLYFPHNNITKILERIEEEKVKQDKLRQIQMHVEGVKLEFSKKVTSSPRKYSFMSPQNDSQNIRKKISYLFPNNEI